jgi:aminoglycoside phosphotransferase (APT) family kinase protein
MLELTAENVPAYLAERGWVSGSFCQVEELSGGVSNVVFRVKTFKGLFVLKQSRAQLRTADPWFSDLSRVFREIDAMQLLAPRLLDSVVPQVLFRDDDNYAFLMSHAPREARDWRTVLLEGKVDPRLGEMAGRILGAIHASTSNDSAVNAFEDRTVFDQLRVDPFYRRVAERCPDVAPYLKPLIDDLLTNAQCLTHGDFSPKNLLLHGDGFTLVDYETAHLGEPSFDIGFFLSHLFLKAIVHPEVWDRFAPLLTGFWRGYQDTFPFKPFDYLTSNGIAHLGACILARVDGTSPAPYLKDERKKESARRIGKRILMDHVIDWGETLEMLRGELPR